MRAPREPLSLPAESAGIDRARDGVGKRSREPDLAHERALWEGGAARVAGLDEVGMGPLAGPVVAAAVVLPPGVRIEGVRDSKRLSARRRERLVEEIRGRARAVGIGVVEVLEVDERNVYLAGLCAMERAVAALPEAPDHLLVDARRLRGCPIPQTSLVRGDATVLSIACAANVAKVHRDARMRELETRYPGYGFARHMGYGTREHMEALRRLGPTPVHRRSFAPVRALLEASD